MFFIQKVLGLPLWLCVEHISRLYFYVIFVLDSLSIFSIWSLQMDDEKEKEKDAEFLEQLEKEFDEFEEQFLKDYRQKRLEELRKAVENT